MVRSRVAFAVFAMVSLALTLSAQAASESGSGDSPKSATGGETRPVFQSRHLETPATKVTSCDVCAGLTCRKVSVRGHCTVDKAVQALRRERGERGGLPAQQHHRHRAVTAADFSPIAQEALPEAGRANAEPAHRPQGAGSGFRLLDEYEQGNLPVSVRESDSLSVQEQSFRPLDLSEETQEDEGNAGGEDDEPGSR